MARLLEGDGPALSLVRRSVETGRRDVLRRIRPSDPSGLLLFDVWVAADGASLAYHTGRSTGTLFVVKGLR